jgi:hypothetical protein
MTDAATFLTPLVLIVAGLIIGIAIWNQMDARVAFDFATSLIFQRERRTVLLVVLVGAWLYGWWHS